MKNLIIVKQLPVIEENLKQLSVEITEKVDRAIALVCNEENVKAVKEVRAELSKEFKELESQRKEVKQAVLNPYNDFEDIYNVCVAEKYKKADILLKEKIDNVENELKKQKETQLREYFEECKIAQKIDFIKFEDVDLKIGLSNSMKSLKEQINSFYEKIKEDLKLIETQEYNNEVLVEYMKTLNVSKAILDVKDRHFILDLVTKEQQEIAEEKMKENELEKKVEAVLGAPEIEEIYEFNFKVRCTKNKAKELRHFLEVGGYDYE